MSTPSPFRAPALIAAMTHPRVAAPGFVDDILAAVIPASSIIAGTTEGGVPSYP